MSGSHYPLLLSALQAVGWQSRSVSYSPVCQPALVLARPDWSHPFGLLFYFSMAKRANYFLVGQVPCGALTRVGLDIL